MTASKWQMTEDQLLEEVVRLCAERGITPVHIDQPYRNRKTHLRTLTGFPDLFVCGPRGVAFRELKKEGRVNLRPAQTVWKYRLLAAGQNWDVWKPSDLESGRIERELDAL